MAQAVVLWRYTLLMVVSPGNRRAHEWPGAACGEQRCTLHGGPEQIGFRSSQLTLRAFDMSTGKSLFAHPFPSLPVQVVNIQGTPPRVADGEIYLVAIGVSGTPGTPGAQPQPMSVVVALST